MHITQRPTMKRMLSALVQLLHSSLQRAFVLPCLSCCHKLMGAGVVPPLRLGARLLVVAFLAIFFYLCIGSEGIYHSPTFFILYKTLLIGLMHADKRGKKLCTHLFSYDNLDTHGKRPSTCSPHLHTHLCAPCVAHRVLWV